jgi:carboxypeptidase Taq
VYRVLGRGAKMHLGAGLPFGSGRAFCYTARQVKLGHGAGNPSGEKMEKEIGRFYEKCRRIHDLQEVQQFMEWDQQVMMPPKGVEQRGYHQSALASVIHGMTTDPELGDLIGNLSAREDLDGDLAADLREAKRARDRAVKVPADLVAERARVCSISQAAWEEAKNRDEFSAFLPHLEAVIRITREMAQAIGGGQNPYDALLDEYEPGMTEAALKVTFSDLRDKLVPLLDKIKGASRKPSQDVIHRRYPLPGQEAFGRKVVDDMGYDLGAGRLDVSTHPFTNGTMRDVRITTRYDEAFLNMALFGTMHEAGHALYEQGLDPARYRDPSGTYSSLGIHESQSRFWENMIGRSRPFWRHYFPALKASFPGVLDGVAEEDFYRAINVVAPTLIRVEADEVTYNLHIILRFELESALLSGTLEAADLPGAWNERVKSFLGIVPPTDREGVLQDIHWSIGLVGYFPTYALGNLYAAQFMEAMRKDMPDLDTRVGLGELGHIKAWLNSRIHVQGRRYLPQELCERVTGKLPSADAAMTYLTAKFGEIYGF